MFKKIFCLAILAVVIFSLSACNVNNGLLEYKAEKIAELQVYADAKGEDNYSDGDWAVICKAVKDGKAAIEVAMDEVGVDTARLAVVQQIDEVEPKEEKDESLNHEENMDELLKNFDLTDPKILFDEASFSDSMYEKVDSIIVTFKKTSTYPILDIHDFNLPNAKSFVYMQATPNDGHLGWVEYDDGHQKGEIFLNEGGKENILEAVRHLDQLEFVKSVRPNHYIVMPC